MNDNQPKLDASGPPQPDPFLAVSVASAQAFHEISRYLESQGIGLGDAVDAISNVLVYLVTRAAKSEHQAVALFDATRDDMIGMIRRNWPSVAAARAAKN